MLLLKHEDVTELLTPELALEALRRALDDQANGSVQMPPRQTTDAGSGSGGLEKRVGANWLRISSALLNGQGVMGFKVMNRAAGIGMRYLVGVYDIESGELLALMDANELTTARTAATSALGTHLLADASSRSVGVLGAGVQARALIRTYALLRDLDEVIVFSPTPASRQQFAEFVSSQVGVPARIAEDAEGVAEAGTVLIAVRATREPVFFASWLRPGMHVTGLSSVRFDAREIDDDTWKVADLVVVDDAVNVGLSGDARSIAESGAFDLSRAAELYQAHTGEVRRAGADDITLFKSAGNAMQDVSLAAAIVGALRHRDEGVDIGQFPLVKPYE